jgi:hypothetical protein
MSEPNPVPVPENKWQRERAAFCKLYPQLLQTHRGKYVAIHEGQLVDSGDELVALALRVYERFGYVPIYMHLVTDEPQPTIRIPSPRVIKGDPTR